MPDDGASGPDTITLTTVCDWLEAFDDRVQEQRAHLTALDSAIGDADHGANMARGMAAVREVLAGLGEDATIADACRQAGMALVSHVGGASGPLYGTFLLRFGTSAGATTMLDTAALADALDAAVAGVVARGKAELGDKTMVDALTPAVQALRAALDAGQGLDAATAEAAEAAARGRDATEPLVARKGRASYLGERSAGHIDPGAASSTLLLEALAGVVARSG